MSIHHRQQRLNVFELLLCRGVLVVIHLFNLLRPNLKQYLLRLLCLENLRDPALMHSTHFLSIGCQLRLVNHL